MRVKKVNIFKDIEKIVLSWRIRHKNNNIVRTRISRWLGRENEKNVARNRNGCGWPSYPPLIEKLSLKAELGSQTMFRIKMRWN